MPRPPKKDAVLTTLKMYSQDKPTFRMARAALEKEKNYAEDINTEDVVRYLLEFWKKHNKEQT